MSLISLMTQTQRLKQKVCSWLKKRGNDCSSNKSSVSFRKSVQNRARLASLKAKENLLKENMVQKIDAEVQDIVGGNQLDYTYFKATFQEAVESKIDRGRLTRYTSGEFIHEDPCECYDLAIKMLDEEYWKSSKVELYIYEEAQTMASDMGKWFCRV